MYQLKFKEMICHETKKQPVVRYRHYVFVAIACAENFCNSGSGDPVKHPEEA